MKNLSHFGHLRLAGIEDSQQPTNWKRRRVQPCVQQLVGLLLFMDLPNHARMSECVPQKDTTRSITPSSNHTW